jgi:hypothetical protein
VSSCGTDVVGAFIGVSSNLVSVYHVSPSGKDPVRLKPSGMPLP